MLFNFFSGESRIDKLFFEAFWLFLYARSSLRALHPVNEQTRATASADRYRTRISEILSTWCIAAPSYFTFPPTVALCLVYRRRAWNSCWPGRGRAASGMRFGPAWNTKHRSTARGTEIFCAPFQAHCMLCGSIPMNSTIGQQLCE